MKYMSNIVKVIFIYFLFLFILDRGRIYQHIIKIIKNNYIFIGGHQFIN